MPRMTILLFVAILLVACASEPTQPLPTPLPTAVYPDSAEDAFGGWGISFGYGFPENFWPEGIHRYAFRLECPPELSTLTYAGNWNRFSVSDEVGLSTEPVYFRINGLSIDFFAPLYIPDGTINPQQETQAIIHFVGISEQVAERAAQECEALIAWDEAPPQKLTPLEPFQP